MLPVFIDQILDLFGSLWRPQATRRDGRACGHWAARFGRTEVLKLLLSCQARCKGKLPKMFQGQIPCGVELVDVGNPTCCYKISTFKRMVRIPFVPVPLSTSHREFSLANLCNFQVNPDVSTTTGITPLMLASYAGHTDACQILLDRRALLVALRPFIVI